MKKIAIIGFEKINNLKAIAGWFKDKDVDVTCICSVENSPFLNLAKELNLEAKFLPTENQLEYFSENKFDLIALNGDNQALSTEVLDLAEKVIDIHPSLLPSFDGENAVMDAFLSDVKVSGITIFYVEKNLKFEKIIAQYPVFKENSMHFDEFEAAIQSVANKLYPIVIEKTLENKMFDFQDLVGKTKSGCGGCNSNGACGSCHH